MTIGQRIAQNRKELGLSQEALGQELGVSRQSIYKWESDAALPEVDKLIALSRRFGVSVGSLLGVEDPAAPETGERPDAPASAELTEAQLKMVEAIAQRYLDAQPKPRRRRWPWVLAAIVLFFAIFNLFEELDVLRMQQASIHDNISRVEDSVDRQISGITSQVEEILKAQNHLTADYGTEVSYISLRRNSALFDVYAVPKTYVEGMEVTFSADNGTGGIQRVPGEPGQERRFSATLSCELTDAIQLTATFLYPDGRQETQLLDLYQGLFSETLPTLRFSDDLMMAQLDENNALVLSREGPISPYVTYNPGAQQSPNAAEVKSFRIGLFKNRFLIAWAEPCDPPASRGTPEGNCQYFCFPDRTIPLADGDHLSVVAVVEDAAGRTLVLENGPPYIPDFESQNLTWPREYRSVPDPSQWSY